MLDRLFLYFLNKRYSRYTSLAIGLSLVLTPWSVNSKEKEIRIIEIRKRLALSSTEKNYKEFFINAGRNKGIEKGNWVKVTRRVPVHDPFLNSSVGDLNIPIAEIEIMHVDTQLSVGRLIEVEDKLTRPMVDFETVMIGDRLDLQTIRTAASKAKDRFFMQAVDIEKSMQAEMQVPSKTGFINEANALQAKPRGVAAEAPIVPAPVVPVKILK